MSLSLTLFLHECVFVCAYTHLCVSGCLFLFMYFLFYFVVSVRLWLMLVFLPVCCCLPIAMTAQIYFTCDLLLCIFKTFPVFVRLSLLLRVQALERSLFGLPVYLFFCLGFRLFPICLVFLSLPTVFSLPLLPL